VPNVIDAIWAALDAYEIAHGKEATILRLGKQQLAALDELVRKYSIHPSIADLRGPKPTFDKIPIEVVEAESHLSANGEKPAS
jgi:hypothetical protein